MAATPKRKTTSSRKSPAKARGKTASASSATVAWSLGAVVLAAGAGLVAFLTRGRIAAALAGDAGEGHVPTDLLDPGHQSDDRATVDFRPDMDAPMTASDRAALAPATIPLSKGVV